MGILEDVMKALDRIPAWKRLNALPAELDALRQHVAELERQLAAGTGEKCPHCGQLTLMLDHSAPEPGPFGRVGAMEDTYRCGHCHRTHVVKRNPRA